MRQSHPDVQDNPSESEIKDAQEEDRRKAQQKLMEEPFIYHEVETRSYYDENREPQSDRILFKTIDIRNLENRPYQILQVVSHCIPHSELDFSTIDKVPDEDDDDYIEYENESDVHMNSIFLSYNI
jgi:hypothetical protein